MPKENIIKTLDTKTWKQSSISLKDFWNILGKTMGNDDLGERMEFSEKNPWASIDDFRKQKIHLQKISLQKQ